MHDVYLVLPMLRRPFRILLNESQDRSLPPPSVIKPTAVQIIILQDQGI
jgi:hypothetical protein